MQRFFSLFSTLPISVGVCAQAVTDPVVTSWIQTSGQNRYLGISANVQKVDYTATQVYVTCSCVPGYDIGPRAGNPNTPANQNFYFKIPRSPKSGHNIIPSNAVTYTPAVSGIKTTTSDVPLVYQQLFRDFFIASNPSCTVKETVQLIDAREAVIIQESFTGTVKITVKSLAPGIYLLSTSNTIFKVVKTNLFFIHKQSA